MMRKEAFTINKEGLHWFDEYGEEWIPKRASQGFEQTLTAATVVIVVLAIAATISIGVIATSNPAGAPFFARQL